MKFLFFISVLSLSLFFSACNNNKPDQIANEQLPQYFFDYSIKGRADDDNLTILLKFRETNVNGKAAALPAGSELTLDGKKLIADSSVMTGIFYELQQPIAEFAGTHYIVVTFPGGKELKEEFEFQPLTLLTVLPEIIPRDSLYFQFEGVHPVDYIRTIMLDTSFFNDGINRLDTISNGQLIIPKKALAVIAQGPVQLEFIREYIRPILVNGDTTGAFRITFTLQKEIQLAQ